MGKKEMGTDLIKKVCLMACFAVVLLISLGTNPSAAAPTFEYGNKNLLSSNATVAELIGEGQPLMESEVSRRFLQDSFPSIAYQVAGDRGSVCNVGGRYHDCIQRFRTGKTPERPCVGYNMCRS